MGEREHVGDDLDRRGGTEAPDVQHRVAEAVEEPALPFDEIGLATDEHGDLASGGHVDPTGDRRLEGRHTAIGGERGQPERLRAVVGARVDPAGPGLTGERLDHPGRAGDHGVDHLW